MGPLEYILIGIAAVFAVLIAIIVIRTLTFRPRPLTVADDDTVVLDEERVVKNLQELVRCKTISSYAPALEDDGEFEKLIGMLPTL